MRKAIVFLSASAILAGVAWQCVSGRRVKEVPAEKPAPVKTPGLIYHGNPGSRVFHGPSCKYYDCKGCVDVYSSREKAVEAGLKPCTICLP